MTMVEVDPKLFIKCRLCLEDSGTYQIVPAVREQISYCFEINVEPFDGLPQLICKKCQHILCDYAKTKKSFIEKQDELKKRTRENNLPQEFEYITPVVKRENSDEVTKYVNKRRKLSVSSNELDYNRESDDDEVVLKNPTIKEETKKQDWKKEYQKAFICRFCCKSCLEWKSARHHSKTHHSVKTKHPDVFKKHCLVKLPKIDNKPNITDSMEQVVHSKNKIIAQFNSNFYISYKYTGDIRDSFSENENIKRYKSFNLDESSDSSSPMKNVRVGRRIRRRRICSRSSNETVVLENNSNGKSQENNCINIDDTDSDDEKRKKEKSKVNKDSINAKMNAVAKLITTTQIKYMKKHEKPEKPSIEQLNRKITTIGRQIINRRGFNSTRLMKYMEHMNLNIIWLSRSPLNVTSNSNYFKIIPRWRYSNEKNINNFEGYKKKYDKPIHDTIQLSRTEEATIVQTTDAGRGSSAVDESSLDAESGIVGSSQSLVYEPDRILSEKIHGPIVKPDFIVASPFTETRKLLNENPVANPRQLPKKFTSDAKKDKAKSAMPTLEVNTNELSEATSSGWENTMQMPIIAFTTSLAVPQAHIPNDTNDNNIGDNCTSGNPVNSNSENSKPTGPRIKVKSVTELMSKETLNRMKESTAPVQNQKMPQNGEAFSTFRGHQVQNPTPSTGSDVRSASPSGYNCDDYVILDTVELPNTKTSSPFKYFRMLLQVHNLILLDTDVTLTGDFHTLIKFKVLYKQETKDQPVILCLSLFCAGKSFCLKIKDRNEDNINMTKISANWQWEVLKIYRGDVVSKVLQNAEKIGPEVYRNTNRFLCLLKSINFVPK